MSAKLIPHEEDLAWCIVTELVEVRDDREKLFNGVPSACFDFLRKLLTAGASKGIQQRCTDGLAEVGTRSVQRNDNSASIAATALCDVFEEFA